MVSTAEFKRVTAERDALAMELAELKRTVFEAKTGCKDEVENISVGMDTINDDVIVE